MALCDTLASNQTLCHKELTNFNDFQNETTITYNTVLQYLT